MVVGVEYGYFSELVEEAFLPKIHHDNCQHKLVSDGHCKGKTSLIISFPCSFRAIVCVSHRLNKKLSLKISVVGRLFNQEFYTVITTMEVHPAQYNEGNLPNPVKMTTTKASQGKYFHVIGSNEASTVVVTNNGQAMSMCVMPEIV